MPPIIDMEGHVIDGRYVLRRSLGQGGMGMVWAAEDPRLEREVAIKIFHPERFSSENITQRFHREARLAARLQHPNIVSVFDFGQDDAGFFFLVMEKVNGPDLSKWLQKDPPVDDVIEAVRGLLRALAFTHARSIRHRDIKPANVLLADFDGVQTSKLADFGVATFLEDSAALTSVGMAVGTPYYMAPEQARGRSSVGPEADIYSVGVFLYEFISGHLPFHGESPMEVMVAKTTKEAPPLRPRKGLEVPQKLIEITMQAVRKRPRDRFPFAAAMDRALQEIHQQSPTPTPPKPTTSSAAESRAAPGRGSSSQPATLDWRAHFLSIDDASVSHIAGRDPEKERLEMAVVTTLDTRRGRTVLLEGPRGSGRTILSRWIATRVFEHGLMTPLVGQYFQSASITDIGIRAALASHLGVFGLSVEEMTEALQRWIDEETDIDSRQLPQILNLLRPDIRSSVLQEPDTRVQLFATAEMVLRALANQTPILLVLDDMHWGSAFDQSFLEHLHIRNRVDPTPIMILLTRPWSSARSTGVYSAVQSGSHIDRITDHKIILGELEPTAIAHIVSNHLGPGHSLRHEIIRRADGSPLVANELAMAAARKLAAGEKSSLELPASLEALTDERISQCISEASHPERVQRMLQHAALCGVRFQSDVLERILGSESIDDLHDDLDYAIGVGLLREENYQTHSYLVFDQEIIRERIVGSLSTHRARRMARQIVAVVTRVEGDTVPASNADLARLYKISGDLERWQIHQTEAASSAISRGEPRKAIELLNEYAEIRQPEAEVILLHARAYYLAGQLHDAMAQLERMIGPSHPIDDLEREYLTLRIWRDMAGEADIADAAQGLSEALAKYDDHRAHDLGIEVDLLRVDLCLSAGENQTAIQITDSLRQRARNPNQRAEAQRRAAFAQLALGDPALAVQLVQSAIETEKDLGPWTLSRLYLTAAAGLQQLDQVSEAQDMWKRALRCSQRAGLVIQEQMALNGLGDTFRIMGNLTEARKTLMQSRTLAMAAERHRAAAVTTINLGLLALEMREPEAAREAFSECWALTDELGVGWWKDLLWLGRAAAEAIDGHLDAAIQLLKEREQENNPPIFDRDMLIVLDLLIETIPSQGHQALVEALTQEQQKISIYLQESRSSH